MSAANRPESTLPDLFSVQETAEMLGVSPHACTP